MVGEMEVVVNDYVIGQGMCIVTMKYGVPTTIMKISFQCILFAINNKTVISNKDIYTHKNNNQVII